MEKPKLTNGKLTALSLGLASLAFSLGACTAEDNQGEARESFGCAVVQNEKGHKISQFNPFDDIEAREIANALCISSGTYYQLTTETVEKVGNSGLFRTSEELAPIFFPSILDHKGLIEKVASENSIPPNVLATLATIESAGIENAESWVGAKGLVQVMPQFHFDKFATYLPEVASYDDYEIATQGGASLVSLEEYNNVFNNPEINLSAGAQFFKECISVAQNANPNLKPDSLVIYGIAAACYNGGAGTARAGYDNMPTESKLYVDHVARILLDVELALKLKNSGYSDDQVLQALKSETMDGLAYAYSLENKSAGYSDFKSDNLIFSALNPESLSDTIAYSDVKNNIDSYYKGSATKYTTPMSPGLRIWFASGGKGLFVLSPENLSWRTN